MTIPDPGDRGTWWVRDSIEHLRKEQGARAVEHYKNQREIIHLLRQLLWWVAALCFLILGFAIARYWK